MDTQNMDRVAENGNARGGSTVTELFTEWCAHMREVERIAPTHTDDEFDAEFAKATEIERRIGATPAETMEDMGIKVFILAHRQCGGVKGDVLAADLRMFSDGDAGEFLATIYADADRLTRDLRYPPPPEEALTLENIATTTFGPITDDPEKYMEGLNGHLKSLNAECRLSAMFCALDHTGLEAKVRENPDVFMEFCESIGKTVSVLPALQQLLSAMEIRRLSVLARVELTRAPA